MIGPEQGCGAGLVEDRAKLPDPIGEQVAAPLHPGFLVFSEQKFSQVWSGQIWQLGLRLSGKLINTSLAEQVSGIAGSARSQIA